MSEHYQAEGPPNTRSKAVALQYSPEAHAAPHVTAAGIGALADRIIAAAHAAGVPVHEDQDLVELLLKLEVATDIPPELYVVVAEILFYLYRVNEDWKAAHGISSATTRHPPTRPAGE